MSQAVAADPSALCKLKQRDGFPSSSLVILAMGRDGHSEGKDVREGNGRYRGFGRQWTEKYGRGSGC